MARDTLMYKIACCSYNHPIKVIVLHVIRKQVINQARLPVVESMPNHPTAQPKDIPAASSVRTAHCSSPSCAIV